MRASIRLIITLPLLWLATLATAQELPAPLSSYVSDYAGLLTQEEDAALTKQLEALRSDNGIEMAVVIMNSMSAYSTGESLEAFAMRLFNTWGIGDKSRNDGILFLVLKDDRLTRIELGKSYAHDWDGTAARILDRDVLPHFKNGEYARGISDGTREIISTIALAHQSGASAPAPKRDWAGIIIMTFMSLVFAAIFIPLLFGRWLRDSFTRMSRCPNCGQRTLEVTRKTKRKATKGTKGEKQRTKRCRNCDYHDTQIWAYSAAAASSSSSSSFGGGSSGGGGASGSW